MCISEVLKTTWTPRHFISPLRPNLGRPTVRSRYVHFTLALARIHRRDKGGLVRQVTGGGGDCRALIPVDLDGVRNVGDTKRGTLAARYGGERQEQQGGSGMRHRGPARRASARRLASLLDGSDARGAVRPSGREWQGSQPGQSASELVFPRPMPWEVQYETAGPAGDASGQGEEAAPEGLGGHHPLVQMRAVQRARL